MTAKTSIASDSKITDRQREKTAETIRKIAELTIKAYGLDCTVDEYIQRCTMTGKGK